MTATAELDRALVSLCQSNDARAFDEILARYQNRVYGFVCRMVGQGEDAEDITQDVFVRAFASITRFHGSATLSTWLYRIAANACIDHVRRAKRARGKLVPLWRREPDTDEDEAVELPDGRSSPLHTVLTAELGDQIDRALATLSPKHRAVVVLHDIDGLEYEEVAQAVGCPLGTVKSRLFHARAALRRELSPYLQGSASV